MIRVDALLVMSERGSELDLTDLSKQRRSAVWARSTSRMWASGRTSSWRGCFPSSPPVATWPAARVPLSRRARGQRGRGDVAAEKRRRGCLRAKEKGIVFRAREVVSGQILPRKPTPSACLAATETFTFFFQRYCTNPTWTQPEIAIVPHLIVLDVL